MVFLEKEGQVTKPGLDKCQFLSNQGNRLSLDQLFAFASALEPLRCEQPDSDYCSTPYARSLVTSCSSN